MVKHWIVSGFAPLTLAVALAITATAAAPPRTLQSRLLADAADGRLDQHSWITAALVAGGIEDSRTLDRHRERYEQVRRQLLVARGNHAQRNANNLGRRLTNAAEQGPALLEWMHREVLTGSYQRECSNVADSLERGDFNCVSSAVLYQALATELGMRCQIVERPEHAWIEWQSPDGARTIETTTPDGVRHPLSTASHSSDEDPNTGGPVRRLNSIESVALVYFNRGTILFERGELPAAIAANLVALQLDPARSGARHNLLAAINNEAVALCQRSQFDAALALLDCGLVVAPREHSLLTNRRLAEQQRDLRAANRSATARSEAANLTEPGL